MSVIAAMWSQSIPWRIPSSAAVTSRPTPWGVAATAMRGARSPETTSGMCNVLLLHGVAIAWPNRAPASTDTHAGSGRMDGQGPVQRTTASGAIVGP